MHVLELQYMHVLYYSTCMFYMDMYYYMHVLTIAIVHTCAIAIIHASTIVGSTRMYSSYSTYMYYSCSTSMVTVQKAYVSTTAPTYTTCLPTKTCHSDQNSNYGLDAKHLARARYMETTQTC